MAQICEKCANEISGETVTCGGFCSSIVCLKCSAISDAMYASIKANMHLVWMCTCCRNLLSKARFSNSLVSVNKASESVIESMKAEIRDSILADIKHEIRSNFKTLINSVPRTPASHYRTPLVASSKSKRPRENDDDVDNPASRPAKSMCCIGTNAADTNLVVPEAPTEDSNMFWLYLSGILPEVPDSKVTELAESKLNSTNLRVVKLVAPGRDIKSLTFVSYKIGMPADLKPTALSTETWPRGIRFREFENKGSKKQFFWRPTEPTPNQSDLTETPRASGQSHFQR